VWRGRKWGDRYLVNKNGDVYSVRTKKLMAQKSEHVNLMLAGKSTCIRKSTLVNSAFNNNTTKENFVSGLTQLQNAFIQGRLNMILLA
jgi:predicted GTPase